MGHDHPKHFLSFLISLLSHIQLFLPEIAFFVLFGSPANWKNLEN